jgi:hypothetical protein
VIDLRPEEENESDSMRLSREAFSTKIDESDFQFKKHNEQGHRDVFSWSSPLGRDGSTRPDNPGVGPRNMSIERMVHLLDGQLAVGQKSFEGLNFRREGEGK